MIAVEEGRGPSSHVTRDGHAKVAYGSQEAADRDAVHMTGARGYPFYSYLCHLAPEHYHLSAGVRDLSPQAWRPGVKNPWLRPGEARGWACQCGGWGVGRAAHERCTSCGRHRQLMRAGVAECALGRASCRSPLHRRGPAGSLDAHVRVET